MLKVYVLDIFFQLPYFCTLILFGLLQSEHTRFITIFPVSQSVSFILKGEQLLQTLCPHFIHSYRVRVKLNFALQTWQLDSGTFFFMVLYTRESVSSIANWTSEVLSFLLSDNPNCDETLGVDEELEGEEETFLRLGGGNPRAFGGGGNSRDLGGGGNPRALGGGGSERIPTVRVFVPEGDRDFTGGGGLEKFLCGTFSFLISFRIMDLSPPLTPISLIISLTSSSSISPIVARLVYCCALNWSAYFSIFMLANHFRNSAISGFSLEEFLLEVPKLLPVILGGFLLEDPEILGGITGTSRRVPEELELLGGIIGTFCPGGIMRGGINGTSRLILEEPELPEYVEVDFGTSLGTYCSLIRSPIESFLTEVGPEIIEGVEDIGAAEGGGRRKFSRQFCPILPLSFRML